MCTTHSATLLLLKSLYVEGTYQGSYSMHMYVHMTNDILDLSPYTTCTTTLLHYYNSLNSSIWVIIIIINYKKKYIFLHV